MTYAYGRAQLLSVDFTLPEGAPDLAPVSSPWPPDGGVFQHSTREVPPMPSYPATFPIRARQGATYRRVFTWTIDGTPVNLSGSTARMEVRKKASASTVVLTATPYITLGGSAGTVDLNIPASVLAAIAPRSGDSSYVYDLEIVTGSVVTTFLAGRFFVAPEVTRS